MKNKFQFDPTNGCLYHPSGNTSWFRKNRDGKWMIDEWGAYLFSPISEAICSFVKNYEGADEVTFAIDKDCKVKVKN
jgi:hypothetical protein